MIPNYSIIKTVGIPKINLINAIFIEYFNGSNIELYQLPLDVLISINGKKVIARDQIVDGVEVFTHVARKAFTIDFDFNLRGKEINFTPLGTEIEDFTFPLDVQNPAIDSQDVRDFFDKVWIPNQLLNIDNKLLNSLHINKILVEDVDFKPERGCTDLNVRLKCYEVHYNKDFSNSLIV